ncbi:MAG TPA: hypothetical protein VF790_14535 [Dissulfurispiraceae bacterium]
MEQRKGALVVSAFALAVGSFILTFATHPLIGLFAALGSVFFGIAGLAMPVPAHTVSGIVSIASAILGAISTIFSCLVLAGVITFVTM